MIVPIAHFPTLKALPAEQAVSVVAEVEQTKSALRSCYAQFNCAFLAFEVERNRGKGGHAHIQVCSTWFVVRKDADKVLNRSVLSLKT